MMMSSAPSFSASRLEYLRHGVGERQRPVLGEVPDRHHVDLSPEVGGQVGGMGEHFVAVLCGVDGYHDGLEHGSLRLLNRAR